MHSYYQNITIYGRVTNVDVARSCFTVRVRSGDEFQILVGRTTYFTVLTNIDNLARDRWPDPVDVPGRPERDSPQWNIGKYVVKDEFLMVSGVFVESGNQQCFHGRSVLIPYLQRPGDYVFEHTHWWIDQIALMADRWLDELFDSTRSYKIDDFRKFYRTTLNIVGGPTDDKNQECATLSRLVYGLSSAYLLTGSERYLMAARAGVAYQREAFRSLSHDGKYCFWAFGRRLSKDGAKLVVPSQNDDDKGTIPLYEQIYALAGLAQYYRVTQDWAVFDDIRRTINSFMDFYHDTPDAAKWKKFPGMGGFFSHIDYATMRPDAPSLSDNLLKKNWNSIGDHIPAYLVNLLLALDPIPKRNDNEQLKKFRQVCREILKETTELILTKFPDPNSDYVNERFNRDWTPDHSWKWQENRGIVGHNLKIAWNMTRVAFYYKWLADVGDEEAERGDAQRIAKDCIAVARDIGNKMARLGLDMVRGGVFDAVERCPSSRNDTEFTWSCTKDFWQQEQGILAYLILHGADAVEPRNTADLDWLGLARETMMFWNCFFLDRDRQGIFFRTTEDGLPVIQGMYGYKGGHSISGYHAFELNYLAHLYVRAYAVMPPAPDSSEAEGKKEKSSDKDFCLYFNVNPNCQQESINVLPDFFPPGKVRIKSVWVNGVERTHDLKPNSPEDFQIRLESSMFNTELAVGFVTT